jgi:phospholipid transport system substrate-binding protein
MKFSSRLIFLFLTVLATVSPALAQQGAIDEVKTTVDRVIQVAEAYPGETARTERRTKLREIISERFDFNEMAKRSLGAEWSKITAEQQAEFVSAFSDLLAKTYLNRIETVTKDTVVIDKESLDFPKSVVKTKVKSDGSVFPIDYRLQNINGAWKVYDVIIENIGLVANYRNEFAGIIRSSGFEGLLDSLKKKVAKG